MISTSEVSLISKSNMSMSHADESDTTPPSLVGRVASVIVPGWVTTMGVALVLCVVLVPISLERLIAQDEGYYAMAAKLISDGRIVYGDFFYPQMPLLPYIYGAWMAVFGFTWESGRVFSALMAVAIGMLLFRRLIVTSGMGFALFGVALYCSCSMAFPWFTVMKTYALSTLLLLAAYSVCEDESTKDWAKKGILTGILFGLAVNVRLFFIVACPAFCWSLSRRVNDRHGRFTIMLAFLAGCAITFVPHLYFLYTVPEAYWFNNVGYHLIRSTRDALAEQEAKLTVLSIMLGLRDTKQFSGLQFPLLMYGALAYGVSCLWWRERIDQAFFIAALLFIVSLLPSPTYVQYFSVLVPFLIILFLRFLHNMFLKLSSGYQKVAVSTVVFFSIALFWGYGVKSDLVKYTRSGIGVIGIGNSETAKDFTLRVVSMIANEVDKVTKPGDMVIALWPGYLFPAESEVLPGLENHFGLLAAARLSQDLRGKYHLLSNEEVLRQITTGSAEAVVFRGRNKKYLNALKFAGYQLHSRIRSVGVYTKSSLNGA